MKDLCELLRILKEDLHFTRNICEHSNDKKVCSSLYCWMIHLIERRAKPLEELLKAEGFPRDEDFYFFSPLEEARKKCSYSCEESRFYFRIAEKYVRNLEKLVNCEHEIQ